jgi:hypothetical protein
LSRLLREGEECGILEEFHGVHHHRVGVDHIPRLEHHGLASRLIGADRLLEVLHSSLDQIAVMKVGLVIVIGAHAAGLGRNQQNAPDRRVPIVEQVRNRTAVVDKFRADLAEYFHEALPARTSDLS